MSGIRRPSASNERGFTLVELMAVVAMTGILGAICTSLVIKHMAVAKNVDGVEGMQSLRVAAGAFKAENGRYLDCSLTSGPQWYPSIAPNHVRNPWLAPSHPDWAQWRLIAVPEMGVTRFGYVMNAGVPGAAWPKFETAKVPPPVPLTEPWYVIQVKGDRDDDGKFMLGYLTSFTGDVYVENDSE